MDNAFGILASRFRFLLGTMEKRPKVVRHVLHNILRTHQGRLDRAPNTADDIAVIARQQHMCLMKTIGIVRGGQNISEMY